ncbi:glycosyltransferase family 4 protein, partial [Vibrio parahaemolyticus]|nr:glycosyltransferase family 4 protein [Vibrio parahaemolyticus]
MKVLLCGPIAEQGKPALGGYQSANLRLARLFSSLSYDVEPLPYPVPHGSLFKKSLAYLSGFSHIVQSLMRYRRRAVLHITPLCKQFLPFELGLVLTAKMRGLKVVVDLRAGNQIELYNERSSAYRTMFRTMLRQADAVTYEGERYARFIADIAPGIPHKLLPNFVPTGLPRTKDTPRPAGGPVMIYVGQLSESKGVFQALEIFHEVRRHAPDALFYLVGADTGTVTRVIQEKMSDAHRGVVFTGSLPFDEIVPLLDAADFFLFLTRFPGEGHSNALPEAMARGCVPVCTRHGFNADVIARSGIVI